MANKSMGGWLVTLLGLIPYVVSGIEQIHGDKLRGAEKKQLALKALGLATITALVADPGHSDAIKAAAQLASVTIDGVKDIYNASKGLALPAPPSAFAVPSQ